MKKFVGLLMIAAFSFQVMAGDKAIGVAGSALQTTSAGGQKWALIVGINEYSNVPTLDFARQDAVALRGSLIKAGFPADNIMLMTDAAKGAMYPTRGNLRARINNIATIVDKDDVLLMFFSGHGTQKLGEGYLVPIDGSSNDTSSLVSLKWVKTTLETSSAKHRLLILDACHSGAKAGDAANSPAKTMLSNLSGAAFATLSSCDASQLSYEDKTSGHGVFTSAIIDGLTGAADKMAQGNNDNVVNATELWAYAALKTKQWGVRTGKVQTPVLRGNFKGLIEITRFKSLEALKAQKEMLGKKLEAMQQLNRTNAVEELKREIDKLEAQLDVIGSSGGDFAGADEVQIAYARYDAAKKQLKDLKALHAEKTEIFRPTSRVILQIMERIAIAESELKIAVQGKSQADAIVYKSLQSQVVAKQAQFDELTKEMLPSAPQAKKLKLEIDELKEKRMLYIGAYYTVNPPAAGSVITSSTGMKLVWVPAGEFMMGSPSPETDRSDDEGPVHKVLISIGFYMGIYEVTQGQYRAVMDANPSYFKGDNRPVERVSWNDAAEFCRKLSEMDSRMYSLPTEAQWEYACRGGTTTPFNTGETLSIDQANYDRQSKKTMDAGSFKKNSFGLYDMHGNVWEWCKDWYGEDYYSNSPLVDPQGVKEGKYRVYRGGSWGSYNRWKCRTADRNRIWPKNKNNYIGFRVVALEF